MADDFSFDIVSKVDMQIIDDSVNAAMRELVVRFDFRGSVSKIELDKAKAEITLNSDNEGKLQSVIEILQTRLAKKGIDLKILDFQKLEVAMGGTVRQLVKIKQGIETETGKQIVADIKKEKLKVTASIQSDQVRVTSKSKDSLQQVMNLLKGKDYKLPLQYSNFR